MAGKMPPWLAKGKAGAKETDAAKDKKAGVKEDSSKDKAMDKKAGVKETKVAAKKPAAKKK